MEPQEILPGLFHWTAVHPRIEVEVSSYWIGPARTLLDPLLPEGGLDWLCESGPPEQVVLTNRHHWRHTSEVIRAFDCPVWCPELGLGEVEDEPGSENVRGFRAGDTMPGGLEAHEVGILCPDETALRFDLPSGHGCLAVADGVVRMGAAGGDGPLGFVPDELIADDPEAVRDVKRGLRDAYRRLCALDWETLLLAHGLPIVAGGRAALRAFAG